MNSENEDSRDGTILTMPGQMQQLAQLQHGNHGNRQQPNAEQHQQRPRQQLPPVGHIRPPRRAISNPRRQRGPRQINQSDEIDVSIYGSFSKNVAFPVHLC